MAENEIVIDVVARLDGIEKQLKGLENTAKETGKKISNDLGDELSNRLSSGFMKLGATFAAAFTIGKLKDFAKAAIGAAAEQEAALNSLNQSLANAGTYSEAASQSFQKLATRIQSTTTIGDDAVLQMGALARNFTKTNEEAEKLTEAAIQLSAATGKGLEESVQQLGKSMSGMTGRLAETLPAVRELTAEQLKHGAAIDLVLSKYSGTAESKINTFEGAQKRLSNTFGELLEEMGNIIIKSPGLTAGFNYISKAVEGLMEKVKGLVGGDGFERILIVGLDISRFLVTVLGIAFETVGNIINAVGKTIGGLAAAIVSLFSGEFRQAATIAKETFLGVFSYETFNYNATNAALGFIDGFKRTVENAPPVMETFKNNVNAIVPVVENVTLTVGSLYDAMVAKMQSGAIKVKHSVESLATTFQSSLAGGIASAFSAFGQALAKGENGFTAFAKAALGALGQIAIQMGSILIAAGLGWAVIPGFQASAAAVSQGIVLTVIGGALVGLSSLGGSGSGSQGASTAGGSAGAVTPAPLPETTALQEPERQEPTTNIAINVQGNILDRRQTGLEIADVINEAFGSNGITIARGALV